MAETVLRTKRFRINSTAPQVPGADCFHLCGIYLFNWPRKYPRSFKGGFAVGQTAGNSFIKYWFLVIFLTSVLRILDCLVDHHSLICSHICCHINNSHTYYYRANLSVLLFSSGALRYSSLIYGWTAHLEWSPLLKTCVITQMSPLLVAVWASTVNLISSQMFCY